MAKSKISVSKSEGVLGRLVASVPEELLQRVDETLLAFRAKSARRASTSAFVEVALRELLDRSDVLDVLKAYDVSAKRTVERRGSKS